MLRLEEVNQFGVQETSAVSASGAASIVQKMLRVMREVGYVQKDGKNEFHGYKYASEASAIAALRPSMVKAGLVLVPSVRSVERDEHGNTHVEVLYRLLDEAGNELSFTIYGSGNDRSKSGAVGDKGIYKALTGASKYALLKTFLLETGDDPEVESVADRQVEKVVEKAVEDTAFKQQEVLNADQNLFLAKLSEHADACGTEAELGALWKANLVQLNQIETLAPDKHAGIKQFFRAIKNTLRGN